MTASCCFPFPSIYSLIFILFLFLLPFVLSFDVSPQYLFLHKVSTRCKKCVPVNYNKEAVHMICATITAASRPESQGSSNNEPLPCKILRKCFASMLLGGYVADRVVITALALYRYHVCHIGQEHYPRTVQCLSESYDPEKGRCVQNITARK